MSLNQYNAQVINKIKFRNRVINGDFTVNQRNQPFYKLTGNGSSLFTIDRYRSAIINNAGGFFDVHHNVNVNTYNSIKFVNGTSYTDFSGAKTWYTFLYTFEGNELYDLVINKKSITISFNMVADLGQYSLSLRNMTVQNDADVDSYVIAFNQPGNNSNVRHSFTIPLDFNWTHHPVNDNNPSFVITINAINKGIYNTTITNTWQHGNFLTAFNPLGWYWGSQSSHVMTISNFQVEEGNIASPFQDIPYHIQLQNCKRYYEPFNYHVSGFYNSPATNYASNLFFSEKRIIPSVNNLSGNSESNFSSTVSVDYITTNSLRIYNNNWTSNTNPHFHFSGELDAEMYI